VSKQPTLPDVSDPDVREMVLRNHEPEEAWLADGRLVSVYCRACTGVWPCPSIQAARKAHASTD
jgi:hypothetical protein